MATFNLTPVNVGNLPTFQRANSKSVIDVTFVHSRITTNRRVLNEFTASDHKYNCFSLADDRDATPAEERKLLTSSPRMGLPQALFRFLHKTSAPDLSPKTTVNDGAKTLKVYLTKACNKCIPLRSSPYQRRKPVYWWTREIGDMYNV